VEKVFVKPLLDDSEKIFFIEGERNGRYPYSNSLLIDDCMFDTGISSGYLRKLKRMKFPINNVVTSHWHEDHISGARLLEDAKYFCHVKDKPLVENIDKYFKTYYGIIGTPAEKLFDSILEGLRLKDIKVDVPINDNDLIQIGNNYKIKVIHTPGHSAGHCCFLEVNSKVAFLADIDFTSFGPWYGGIDSNLIEFEESIAKLKQYDIEIAVTSHKGVFQGKKLVREKLDEYQGIIDQRDDLILENLSESKPTQIEELTNKNIIYKFYSEFGAYETIAEKIMLEKHFEKLIKKNVVKQVKNGYVLI